MKFTTKKLIEKGLKEPDSKSYCNFTRTYCKLWEIGNFSLRITPRGNIQVFEDINGELIKVIKDEKVLDAFIVFAMS